MPKSKPTKTLTNKFKRYLKAGQPTVMTEELQADILSHVATGGTIRSYCRKYKHPNQDTVFNFMALEAGEKFSEAMLRAREKGSHAMAEQCIDLADNEKIDPMHKKIMVDVRLRLIGQWNRKHYSTRPGDGDPNKLTLGELVEAAIAHGKQLETQQAAKQLIDITPSAETTAPLHAMRDLAHAALAPPTDQVQRRTRRAASE